LLVKEANPNGGELSCLLKQVFLKISSLYTYKAKEKGESVSQYKVKERQKQKSTENTEKNLFYQLVN